MSIVNTKDAVRLAKFGMDSAATTAFLASAVIAFGIATKTIAISSLPASLGFLAALATPLGITILLGFAVYFALSAFTSFQQLQENRDLKANINVQAKKIEEAEASIEAQTKKIEEVKASISTQATEAFGAVIRDANIPGQVETAITTADIPGQVETAITTADIPGQVQSAITTNNLVTQNALDSAIEGFATKNELETKTQGLATQANFEGLKAQVENHNTELGQKADQSALTGFASQAVFDELKGRVNGHETELGKKLGKDELSTEIMTVLKTEGHEVIQFFDNKYQSIAG